MTRGGVHVLALRPSSRLCAAELSGARSEFQRPVLTDYDQRNERLPSLNRTGTHVSTVYVEPSAEVVGSNTITEDPRRKFFESESLWFLTSFAGFHNPTSVRV